MEKWVRRRAADSASLAWELGSGHTGLRERDDQHKVWTKGLFRAICWLARRPGLMHLSSVIVPVDETQNLCRG